MVIYATSPPLLARRRAAVASFLDLAPVFLVCFHTLAQLGIHASSRTCAARGRQGAAVLSRGRLITDRREKRRGSVETRPRMAPLKIEPFR